MNSFDKASLTLNASELRSTIWAHSRELGHVLAFSLVTTLLALVPAAYMFQVYDRVLNSASYRTLAILTVVVLIAYAFLALVEHMRMQTLLQVAAGIDDALRSRVFNAVIDARQRRIGAAGLEPFADLRVLRDFIPSLAAVALCEAPFSLLILIFVFAINPVLGMFALIGALAQFGVGVLTERRTAKPFAAASRAAVDSQSYFLNVLRNAPVARAMGMEGGLHRRWSEKQSIFIESQAQASEHAGFGAASSKFIQTAQGSVILGVGCWLVLEGTLTGGAGMMLVASILGARALAPMVQLVAQWRALAAVSDAYRRLDSLLSAVTPKTVGMSLPAPVGRLLVESATAIAPGGAAPILRNISFAVLPGETVAVVGPSASGKTSLLRLLVGAWPCAAGKVRLDGADVFQWNKEELGPNVGYLPQDVLLFDGTIAENIARFGAVDMAEVERIGRQVGLEAAIADMPQGYEQIVGEDGAFLSGGQRQRIGLARALYGSPKFVVLDEPDSSLDESGETALLEVLLELKGRRVTVVVVTHRPETLAAADKILLLRDGQVQVFGARDDVLRAVAEQRAHGPATTTAADRS